MHNRTGISESRYNVKSSKVNHTTRRPSPADIARAWAQAQSEPLAQPVSQLHSGDAELFSRFSQIYPQLCTRSRRSRRSLQRALGTSLAGIALMIALGHAPSAEAADITVDQNCPTTGSGCTLIAAIHNANTDTDTSGGLCAAGSGADTITLACGSGAYTLSTFDNGTPGNYAAGYNGLPVIASPVTIEGNGATIERGPQAIRGTLPEFRIIKVAATGDLALNDTTISGGNAGYRKYGGGILSLGSLTLSNSTVSGNSGAEGGGIFSDNSGSLTLNNSTVSGNNADYYGGGISGNATLTDSTVSGNSSLDNGGGIRGIVSLNNSTVSENNSTDGGGVFGTATLIDSIVSGNYASFEGGGIRGNAYLTNSTVSGNSAGYRGGGIYGPATLTDSTVSGNSAYEAGGGIYGTTSLTNSTVSGNSAYNGAGILGGATLTNSTVSGNNAGGIGGGILGGGTLTNSTVSGNSANYGGGIYAFSSLTASNSIIAGNSATATVPFNYGPDIFAFGVSVVSGGHNLIGDDKTSYWPAGVIGDQVGTAVSPIDPLLGPLQNNGGPTETHALLPGSPAIDTAGLVCEPTDQRGIVRPQGPACDIGAFELEIAPPMDTDFDTVPDAVDNCINVSNPDQFDVNGDGIGSLCDADITGPDGIDDCLVNFLDLQAFKDAFFSNPASPSWNPEADLDNSGLINFVDLQIAQGQFFGPPGPSANGCTVWDGVLVETGDPAFVNQSIGTLLNGTSDAFPASGDPFLDFTTAPDLSPAQSVLGGWLDQPVPDLSAPGWSATPVPAPSSWQVDTEIALVYVFESGGITNLVAEFGVDNGMFVWLDGVFVGGALRPGGVALGEHTFNLGNLDAGTHYLQIVLEDHGLTNGYAVRITADEVLP